ncbi:hypothetical protein [Microlunatus ginsengisoli]
MTIISTQGKLRRTVVGGMIALAAAAPIALASAPAQATTTSSSCSVTPLRPYFVGFNSSGVKLVRYKVTVKCSADRSIAIEQRRYDTVPSPDKYLGQSVLKHTFGSTGTVSLWVTQALPETGAGNEHVRQRVRFRVASHGVTSAWTSWEYSPTLSIPN